MADAGREQAAIVDRRVQIDPEVALLRSQVKDLREQAARLQAEVDKGARLVLINILCISDPGMASAAVSRYDLLWFNRQLFSYEKLQEIASALLSNTANFVEPNPLWKRIVLGDEPLDGDLTDNEKYAIVNTRKIRFNKGEIQPNQVENETPMSESDEDDNQVSGEQ